MHAIRALKTVFASCKDDFCPRRVLAQRPKPEEAPLESPGVYKQGQRIFVEKVRNVFVMGEALSI